MTPILQRFISEARDYLQSISEKLLDLEKTPGDVDLMSDLFRSVHTLKGNSGLFEFPELTRVLYAAEDLMSVVRDGGRGFSRVLADRLLDAMDFVSLLLDEIEAGGKSSAAHVPASVRLAESLRELIAAPPTRTFEPAAAMRSAVSAETASMADAILDVQMNALGLADAVSWLPGRLKAIAATLAAVYRSTGRGRLLPALEAALKEALRAGSAASMLDWMKGQTLESPVNVEPEAIISGGSASAESGGWQPPAGNDASVTRYADDGGAPTTVLKVDQEKIDRLMNLIGEMVVAKNGLPFLASRAETVYGARELSREIKTQYAVINRIAEEMQDTIIQVRMMPVSGIFQRLPRMVRDISRKLGKQVRLTLEGEETEADKNIIEALADPLIHIVRNSLDHGIEIPEVRSAAGKPVEGHLVIRATRDSGRVFIDISDDGMGIDPKVIKRKAYENGIIDEATLERISDQDAINLVFAAGFSTAAVVSDLSGRGVGMDAVRAAVERVNGTVTLQSTAGQGTTLRLSLPLSMAVTNVMVVESNKQIFGVPMDMVLETLRVPRGDIRSIKNRETTILRDRILPMRSLNDLLAAGSPQVSNGQGEMATLVVQIHGEQLGIVVDDFRDVVDIILKPLGGILGGVSGYSGSALLGDGSVLMVLNPKELISRPCGTAGSG